MKGTVLKIRLDAPQLMDADINMLTTVGSPLLLLAEMLNKMNREMKWKSKRESKSNNKMSKMPQVTMTKNDEKNWGSRCDSSRNWDSTIIMMSIIFDNIEHIYILNVN